MERINPLLDLPPPLDPLHYIYDSVEHYLDTTTSASQSPPESPYDVTYGTDPSSISTTYPSPGREDGPGIEPIPCPQAKKPAAKRKRENRYKNAPPSVLSRRRAQNRASQRAYRERKDQRIKDLETMLKDTRQQNDALSDAYAALHTEYIQLKMSQLKETDQGHSQQRSQQLQHHGDRHVSQSYSTTAAPLAGLDLPIGLTSNNSLDLGLFSYQAMGNEYPL